MGRKSKATVRKIEILEHFFEVVRTEGYEHASVARIADRMQVNPSLLIHYFKTKEEMVVDLVDFLLQKQEQAFLGLVLVIDDPRERLDRVISILFSTDWNQAGDPSVFYACYYLTFRQPRIHNRFVQMYEHFRKLLIAEADIWVRNGLVKNQTPAQIADYLIILVEGFVFYQRLRPLEEQAQQIQFLRNTTTQILLG